MQYMKALLLAQSKEIRDDGSILEVAIWRLSEPVIPDRFSASGCARRALSAVGRQATGVSRLPQAFRCAARTSARRRRRCAGSG